MPPALACRFTVGEQAVLKIVADEARSRSLCDLSIPEIAARAGVGQTKVRMALKEAARLGLVTIEERRVPYRPNLPNVVRIISREWLAWIARAGRSGGDRHNGQKIPSVPKAPLLDERVHKAEDHGQQGFTRRADQEGSFGDPRSRCRG
jgi:hypothetical protein